MTYSNHLKLLIHAALDAVPGLSCRSLSLRAGLGPNWIGEFMADGSGTFSRAERIVAVIRDLCPSGESGAEVRRLLVVFDAQANITFDERVAS